MLKLTYLVPSSTLKNISPGPKVVGDEGRATLVGGASPSLRLSVSSLRFRCPAQNGGFASLQLILGGTNTSGSHTILNRAALTKKHYSPLTTVVSGGTYVSAVDTCGCACC